MLRPCCAAGSDGDLRQRPDRAGGQNPINRFLIWIYRPVIKGLMRAKTLVILLWLAVLAVTIWPARQLGTEFMPNL
jgi:Cu/Ag efflux pump CusA